MEYKIKEIYIDNNGKEYNHIREINFPTKEIMRENMGKYICETEREKGLFFSTSAALTEGVYIYQTNYDRTRALRIFKDWAVYYPKIARRHVYRKDPELIEEIKVREKYIKLTEFPTGIVTLEDYIIGQEIPFYEQTKTLFEISKEKNINEILQYYIDMIRILNELAQNNIIYTDCHTKNFVVNYINNIVRLIDFEPHQVFIDENKNKYKDMMFKIKQTINIINNMKNIPFEVNGEDTLEELEESILSQKYKYE